METTIPKKIHKNLENSTKRTQKLIIPTFSKNYYQDQTVHVYCLRTTYAHIKHAPNRVTRGQTHAYRATRHGYPSDLGLTARTYPERRTDATPVSIDAMRTTTPSRSITDMRARLLQAWAGHNATIRHAASFPVHSAYARMSFPETRIFRIRAFDRSDSLSNRSRRRESAHIAATTVPSGLITGVSMATARFRQAAEAFLTKTTGKTPCTDMQQNPYKWDRYEDGDSAIPVQMAKDDWPDEFLGYCVDSGATASVVGQKQLQAYEAMLGHKIPKKRGKKTFRFGSGKHKTYARFEAIIPTPAGCYLTVTMSVVLIDIPFLFGLEVLKKYNLQLDFMHDKIKSRCPKWEMDLSYRGGHVFFSHNTSPASILYTKAELTMDASTFHAPVQRETIQPN